MDKPIIFTTKCLEEISKCFSGTEEFVTFTEQIDRLVNDLNFSKQVRDRIHDDEVASVITLVQIGAFCLLCREHIDLVQQIISKLEYREVTDQELKEGL